jgi:hypothetical protein
VLYWARRLADQHATWSQASLGDRDPRPNRIQKDFGPALKRLLRKEDQEIARRVKLKFVRFAKVALDEHPHRVYYVFPALGQPKVVVQPSPRRVWQIAGIATGAFLLLMLINWLIA